MLAGHASIVALTICHCHRGNAIVIAALPLSSRRLPVSRLGLDSSRFEWLTRFLCHAVFLSILPAPPLWHTGPAEVTRLSTVIKLQQAYFTTLF